MTTALSPASLASLAPRAHWPARSQAWRTEAVSVMGRDCQRAQRVPSGSVRTAQATTRSPRLAVSLSAPSRRTRRSTSPSNAMAACPGTVCTRSRSVVHCSMLADKRKVDWLCSLVMVWVRAMLSMACQPKPAITAMMVSATSISISVNPRCEAAACAIRNAPRWWKNSAGEASCLCPIAARWRPPFESWGWVWFALAGSRQMCARLVRK